LEYGIPNSKIALCPDGVKGAVTMKQSAARRDGARGSANPDYAVEALARDFRREFSDDPWPFSAVKR
jgi:hypothetical protein